MSTASLTHPASKTFPRRSAILRRFAWKEYRTLRGLWLAVLVLGLAIQWLSGVLLPPQTDWPTLRLYVALAAATLYAAGAAAILFSIEHEDGTYDFLNGLPATWLPVFAGKLLLATASAIALAATLTFTGLMASGFKLPGDTGASLAVGIFGVAILEAIAWGTLFSLLLKRPLAAAIMTLVLGALAVHLAVNATGSNSIASLDPNAYVNAIPLRLAIIVAVFACCIPAARRWLATHTSSKSATPFQTPRWLATVVLSLRERKLITRSVMSTLDSTATNVASRTNRGRRATMLARLLWQSWRESWKWLLAPLLIGLALPLTGSLVVGMAASAEASVALAAASLFFTPALYGALAFSADQRRGQVRFLAEHAAAPRYVWLARHFVWLGTLVVLFIFLAIAASIFVLLGVRYRSLGNLPYDSWYFESNGLLFLQELVQAATNVAAGTALACLGALTAYAIGQLCSMALRSEILAAFLALVLAVALSAWVALLFVWDLSGWIFLVPLAAGLMLATWLRAPAWIAGRNTWRAWVKPALAVVAPLVFVGLLLPQQRLAQVQHGYQPPPGQVGHVAETPESSAALKQLNAEAEETAQMYLKATDMLHAPLADDPLAPWSDAKYAAEIGSDDVDGIDETKVPADQLDALEAAKKRERELRKEAHEAAIKLAIEASQRPTCRFKFNLSPTEVDPRWRDTNRWRANNLRLEPDKTYEALDHLLTALTFPTIFGEPMLEQLLAGLRMSAHLRSGQPTTIFIRQLKREQEILQRIGQWAASEKRTNDERREAFEKLQALFGSRRPNPVEALWADQALIRSVITGKDLPLILAEEPVQTVTYLAYLANELPWERERALAALDIITGQNVSEANNLISSLRSLKPNGFGSQNLRRWLLPNSGPWSPTWNTLRQAAETSYLLRLEYDARVPIHELFREYLNTETSQRAVLIEIALAMHRKDHGEYPRALADLVPDYLERELIDPYSQQPFQYVPGGLDAPLVRFTRDGEIDPGTPLFWSGGPSNGRLTRSDRDVSVRDDEHPDAPRVEKLEPYYSLSEQHPIGTSYRPSALVFPLPK